MVNFNMDFKDYKIISTLGQCFEGRAAVNLARHLPSGTMVALKKFNMDKVREDSSLVDVSYNFNTAILYINYSCSFSLK